MPVSARLKRLISLSFSLHGMMRDRLKRASHPDAVSFPKLVVLRFILERKDPPMKDVAAFLGVTPPSATALIDGLAADGLVARKPDPRDRRGVLLRATPKGRRLVQACFARVSAQVAEMFGRLTIEEQDRLIAIFEKLLV